MSEEFDLKNSLTTHPFKWSFGLLLLASLLLAGISDDEPRASRSGSPQSSTYGYYGGRPVSDREVRNAVDMLQSKGMDRDQAKKAVDTFIDKR